MAKKQGLGRNLDTIYLENEYLEAEKPSGKINVPISQLDTKEDQPRKTFDSESLAGLADSIAANGIIQPILVRKMGERYEIIAGERRFRAAKLAGLNEVPAVIVEADDVTAAKYALIENIQREDLNPYEEAKAYLDLSHDHGLSQEEISAQVGKSRSAIANSLRLLTLPDGVRDMLIDGTLSAGHARALLGLTDRAKMQPLAERCVARNLSVREIETLVRSENKKTSSEARGLLESEETVRVNYFEELESRFTRATGRRCKISESRNKKLFQLEYRDNDDLIELLKALAGDGVLDEY